MKNHFIILPAINDSSVEKLAENERFTILEPISIRDHSATTILKRRSVADQVDNVVKSKNLKPENVYLILHGSDIVANGERVKGQLFVEQSDPLSLYSGRIYAFHRNGLGVKIYNLIKEWNENDKSDELCSKLKECITNNIKK